MFFLCEVDNSKEFDPTYTLKDMLPSLNTRHVIYFASLNTRHVTHIYESSIVYVAFKVYMRTCFNFIKRRGPYIS